MKQQKTTVSAWLFRLTALALVAAIAVSGWMFWKGGYLGGKKQDPETSAVSGPARLNIPEADASIGVSEPLSSASLQPAPDAGETGSQQAGPLSTDAPRTDDPEETRIPGGPDTEPAPDSEPDASAPETAEPGSDTEPVTEPDTEAETEPVKEETPGTVTLLAVGDNLIHNMVYRSGWGYDPWNYDHLYQYVKADVEAADVAIINQETIFVTNHEYVSNYPRFGTPREIGDAVYKAGFDVILHASNHVMDMGFENIMDAIDYWSDKDVTVLGIHKSPEDAEIPVIIERNGIRIGMLNYTYGTNGIPIPSGKEWAVDLLDDKEKLKQDIEYLERNADITIGFFHLGQEYSVVPTYDSKSLVEMATAAGVDIMFNAHPHVLQPYEMYTASNGNQSLVYYSLGNFVSAQERFDSLLGGMAKVTIHKTEEDGETRVEIESYDLVPLVTHTARDDSYAIYKLEDYTDELGAKNVLCPMTTSRLWKRFYQIVGEPKDDG